MAREKKTDLFIPPNERRRRIEMIMKQRGLTHYAMAKGLRRTQTGLMKTLECKNPKIKTIVDIAYLLGVSGSFLIDYDPRGKIPKNTLKGKKS